MGFYEQISKYYDYIFPVSEQQLRFIKETAGKPPKKILDVACGSGGYSIELAKSGYEMSAADLEEEMVRKASENAGREHLNIAAYKCDMRKLDEEIDSKFDSIFCIGNSIVHLGTQEEIAGALRQMYGLLVKNGSLVLQIINFDRIIKYGISELPTIKNDETGLEFIRKYEYDRIKGLIGFNTILSINNSGGKEVYKNSIELFPLISTDMMRLLKDAGFDKIEYFGDFEYTPYSENSYLLVVKAVK